jgi:hypothetical protein
VQTETSTPATYDHEATYSPQDDKIRLYFAFRIPRPEWDALRAAGFVWCMKQAENGGADMAAIWTPEREDIALGLAGEIGDEDQPREERAADRAERFAGYQEKREGEAVALADRFDAGPRVHGNQDRARAERSAARHDRVAGRAVTQWGTAEYWQSRTARVIAHALYVERADVRHRRIKGLEADLRRIQAEVVPSKVYEGVDAVREYRGEEYVAKGHDCVGIFGQGRGRHARSYAKAAGLLLSDHGQRVMDHLVQRIAYEKQMLGEQGGTGADMAEIEAGGFVGASQVQKVTKDQAGRISKVYFLGPYRFHRGEGPAPLVLHAIDAEDIKPGTYRAPTDAERAAFKAAKKAASAAKPKAPPLLNLSEEDAQRLQALWNQRTTERRKHWNREPAKVVHLTQEQYSARSGGTYCTCETKEVRAGGDFELVDHFGAVARIRTTSDAVVVITDKPATSVPAGFWDDALPALKASVSERIADVDALSRRGWLSEWPAQIADAEKLWRAACVCGLAFQMSQSQFGLTAEGVALVKAAKQQATVTA